MSKFTRVVMKEECEKRLDRHYDRMEQALGAYERDLACGLRELAARHLATAGHHAAIVCALGRGD